VRGNKDDAADARAIWMSAQHADIRRIPVKGEQQQAELSVHRLRSHWVSLRTSTINALRGLLYEFGVVLSKGSLRSYIRPVVQPGRKSAAGPDGHARGRCSSHWRAAH